MLLLARAIYNIDLQKIQHTATLRGLGGRPDDMNLVWFKKDLRAHDHAPLAEAIASAQTVGLFIFEPEWYKSPEFSPDHLRFAVESLENLIHELSAKGVPFIIRHGTALEVFKDLHSQHGILKVFAHQETGQDWTFKRDLQVMEWFRLQQIEFKESLQLGVIRKLKDRDTWNKKRKLVVDRPDIEVGAQYLVTSPWRTENLPYDLLSKKKHLAQKGGRKEALRYLESFLYERGDNYMRSLSSPVRAFEGCSRISPYLSWGNLSVTEIQNLLNKRKQSLSSLHSRENFWWMRSLRQFKKRLWWRCHFIQKLETEPEVEFKNFNRKFDGMRESQFDESKFQAWCKGETGFPMVDACMRALHQHGWINFRMRAMLMSFASYQLWLHWKKPAEFLAKQFIDYEPGIHYSQAQMQSGVTGINTIRIYSPQKQLLDQDPEGEFIKMYIPELKDIPKGDLAHPHLMPPLLQLSLNFAPGSSYPLPIVDPKKSYKEAQQRIFEWKTRPEVRRQSKHVYQKHGSRK